MKKKRKYIYLEKCLIIRILQIYIFSFYDFLFFISLSNVESNDFSAISRESYTSNLLTFMMSYILPLLSSEEYTVHEVSV